MILFMPDLAIVFILSSVLIHIPKDFNFTCDDTYAHIT